METIELRGLKEEREVREKEFPVYLEPKTNYPQLIEVTFG
jgi:hypothetical protein